jgi:eukaryotic-like serine/threonine-protein kinase
MVRRGDLIAEKYLVEERLGEGGMGTVYAARHLLLGQRFALKVLAHPERALSASRLINEARALVRMRSEHAVRIHDVVWSSEGAPVLVLELLQGRDLGATLEADGPLAESLAVSHVLDACEAVAEAHALGVLHRDLKPKNLFLTTSASGETSVRVIDFGVAKELSELAPRLTADGAFTGSPSYASPEQARGESLDERSDVWALGVVAFELVAGHAPVGGAVLDVLNAVVTRDAPELASVVPQISTEFSAIVARCLRRDRSERWPSVVALANELARLAPDGVARLARLDAIVVAAESRRDDTGATIDPLPSLTRPQETPKRRVRRRSVGVVATALVGLALLALLALLAYPRPVPVARAHPALAPLDPPTPNLAPEDVPPARSEPRAASPEARRARLDRHASRASESSTGAVPAREPAPVATSSAQKAARSFDDLVQTRR